MMEYVLINNDLLTSMVDNHLLSKSYLIDTLFGLVDLDKENKMKFRIVNDNTISSSI